MAAPQAAYAVEKAIGHDPEHIKQDVANYTGKGEGNPAETMKALTWQGKQKVQVGMFACNADIKGCPARANRACSSS
jgi:hypothetical protein